MCHTVKTHLGAFLGFGVDLVVAVHAQKEAQKLGVRSANKTRPRSLKPTLRDEPEESFAHRFPKCSRANWTHKLRSVYLQNQSLVAFRRVNALHKRSPFHESSADIAFKCQNHVIFSDSQESRKLRYLQEAFPAVWFSWFGPRESSSHRLAVIRRRTPVELRLTSMWHM